MLHQVLKKIDQAQEESINIWCDFLKFPGISTDPAFNADCRATADWLMKYLESSGLKTSQHETTGQPAIIARWGEGKTHLPHVLFYGHYDVQPVDPLNLWRSPPFEPRLGKTQRGRPAIFARGASDDKGQLLTFLEASRLWLSVHGSLPFRLTVLIEGDEEGDSQHIAQFLEKQGKALKADIAFICDTEIWDDDVPAITTSLRGCIAEDVTITAPRIDLHSGYYGGPATNPIKVLSCLLDKLHDKNGRITIPNFYDGVKRISKAKAKQWESLKFKAKDYLGEVGQTTASGEKGFSLAEQLWARPTCEVNGISGGYQGAGTKTVLPAEATAKITFRLVEGQNPKKIRARFRRYLTSLLPPNCKIKFETHGGDSTGIAVDEKSPWVKQASSALAEEWGKPTALVGSGVSIPVVSNFKDYQQMESLLIGFSRFDDGAHSPNEKYDLECFHKGMRSWARLIGKVAEGKIK
jgi:acetylornithine deacetylase/succinyl-diaminopimelate desuccinylase-like protein